MTPRTHHIGERRIGERIAAPDTTDRGAFDAAIEAQAMRAIRWERWLQLRRAVARIFGRHG